MNSIVAYLIAAITILVLYNAVVQGNLVAGSGNELNKGFDINSREIGLLILVLILGMTESTVVMIIVLSGMTVMALYRGKASMVSFLEEKRNLDEETTILFLLAITGLIIITETSSLIILYLGLEMIGLTFYVLASRERKGVKSTEAGIKYFIIGALSSGLLLLGISLVYATTGTTGIEFIEGIGGTLIKIGLLFKIGATPLHLWVPDVYEGSPIIVTTFLAVVPKIAYMTVLMRLTTATDDLLLLCGVLSIIVGSIGALNQTKLKRMLAYSAIGHMGFMLIGVGIGTYASFQATIIYMIIYIMMTINSFSLIMELGLQKIVELRGISRRNGIIGMTMGLSLMSIAGIPPLAGFYSKYQVIRSAVESNWVWIAIIAVIFSVISSFYYVRLIRWMYFEDNAELTVINRRMSTRVSVVLGATTYGIVTLMLYPTILMNITLPVLFLA